MSVLFLKWTFSLLLGNTVFCSVSSYGNSRNGWFRNKVSPYGNRYLELETFPQFGLLEPSNGFLFSNFFPFRDEDEYGKYLGNGWFVPDGPFGKNAILICEFSPSDYVVSNVIWSKVILPSDDQRLHGIFLSPSSSYRTQSYTRHLGHKIQAVLKIEDVGPQDYGNYLCQATSDRSRWMPKYSPYRDVSFHYPSRGLSSLQSQQLSFSMPVRDLSLGPVRGASISSYVLRNGSSPIEAARHQERERSGGAARQPRFRGYPEENVAFRRTTITVYKTVSLHPVFQNFPYSPFGDRPSYY